MDRKFMQSFLKSNDSERMNILHNVTTRHTLAVARKMTFDHFCLSGNFKFGHDI